MVDFNNDRRQDILWRNNLTDETAIWEMDFLTDPILGKSVPLPSTGNSAWEIQGQVDLINNITADILWRNYSTGENAIWDMNGSTFGQATLLTPVEDTAWQIEGLADFITGDAKDEILWRNYRTGENGIWQLNSTIEQPTLLTEQPTLLTTVPDTDWEIKGLADFTGGGKDEILWRNNRTGENGIWQLNDDNTEQATLLTTVPVDSGWDIEGQADFTGNGTTDILWRNYRTGENAIWEMNGTTEQPILLTPVADTRWQIEGVADFTGDNNVDILWRNYGTDESGIWEMNRTQLTDPVLLPTTGNTGWEINFSSSFP